MSKNKYNWPLGHSSMTTLDKLKIGKFILTNDKWTVGPEIKKYEDKWSEYTRCPYVVMVSSGSAANELIALHRKQELKNSGEWTSGKNKVLFNAINWISSVSVFINYDFKPVFVDVSKNLNPSVEQIIDVLDKDSDIKTIFYTTLLGFSCDLEKLVKVCKARGIKLLLDNCESSFSWEEFNKDGYEGERNDKIHFCNITLSSTSIYASHFTSGMQEGGLIFCQDQDTYDFMCMARNHGMTRGMPDKYRNYNVDKSFDFHLMGSNYRSTNLIAYMHSLDFDRSLKWSNENRKQLSETFYAYLNPYNLYKFHYPHTGQDFQSNYVPLALPIIKYVDYNDPGLINRVKGYLDAVGVGYRGLVGGNLCNHTAFKAYGKPEDYPIANYFDKNSIYIGLHAGVTYKMVKELAKEISKL